MHRREVIAPSRFALLLGAMAVLAGVTCTWAAGSSTGRRMPLPARVLMRRWSDTSSGPAALGTILSAYGRRLTPAQLEQACGAVNGPATLAGLQTGAQSAHLKTAIVTTTAVNLPPQPLPGIAEWPDGAFRVFIDTGPSGVEVFDPSTNIRAWVPADQLAGWTGRLLLINPTPL